MNLAGGHLSSARVAYVPLPSQLWENRAESSEVRSGRWTKRPPGRISVPNTRENTVQMTFSHK